MNYGMTWSQQDIVEGQNDVLANATGAVHRFAIGIRET